MRILQLLYAAAAVCLLRLIRAVILGQRPTITSGSQAIKEIIAKCPTLTKYRPTPWLLTGLGQTIAATRLPHPECQFIRQEIQLQQIRRPPGRATCPPLVPQGVVSVDWLEPEGLKPLVAAEAPIVVIVPGLTSSSREGYVKRAAMRFLKEGWRVACYNPRGRGGNPVDTPMLYSVGYTEDLRAVISKIRAANPVAPMMAVGYSLGVSLASSLAKPSPYPDPTPNV